MMKGNRTRLIIVGFALFVILLFSGCGKKEVAEEPPELSKEQLLDIVVEHLQTKLDKQIEENNIPYKDLTIKASKITIKDKNYNSYEKERSYFVRTEVYLTSNTISELLLSEKYSDELCKILDTLEYDKDKIEFDGYYINTMSSNAYNVFKDNEGNSYTVSKEVLLKNNKIVYIASDAELTRDAEIGETIIDTPSTPQTTANPEAKNRSNDDFGHDKFDAIAVAEKKVKEQLKSPSTAKFCKVTEYDVTCIDNTWTVKGWVDAQNSFGATIRNTFTVNISFSSSTNYTSSCSIS